MLLSESSRKFCHTVAYSNSVGWHCWTNWRQGGCRWRGWCRVQRTREWQIEGYIVLVATNNPQELKSELWYSRINGTCSLIMHLMKDKKQHSWTLLRNQVRNEIQLSSRHLLSNKCKNTKQCKVWRSYWWRFQHVFNLNRLSYLFKVVPDQLKNKASVNQRQKIIQEKGKTGV